MDLSIAEKFLLLAQHPSKGKYIISGVQLQYAIVGALLLEIALDHRLDIVNEQLTLKSTKTKADPLINEIEKEIKKSEKPRKIKYWVNKLARKQKLFKTELLNKLAKKRKIRIERKTFLGIISYKEVYLVDKKLQKELINKLKESLLSNKTPDSKTVVLLALIQACKMYKIFPANKTELITIKNRLKQIIEENPIAESVDKTIQEVQAAIFVAIMASTIAATSSSH